MTAPHLAPRCPELGSTPAGARQGSAFCGAPTPVLGEAGPGRCAEAGEGSVLPIRQRLLRNRGFFQRAACLSLLPRPPEPFVEQGGIAFGGVGRGVDALRSGGPPSQLCHRPWYVPSLVTPHCRPSPPHSASSLGVRGQTRCICPASCRSLALTHPVSRWDRGALAQTVLSETTRTAPYGGPPPGPWGLFPTSPSQLVDLAERHLPCVPQPRKAGAGAGSETRGQGLEGCSPSPCP